MEILHCESIVKDKDIYLRLELNETTSADFSNIISSIRCNDIKYIEIILSNVSKSLFFLLVSRMKSLIEIITDTTCKIDEVCITMPIPIYSSSFESIYVNLLVQLMTAIKKSNASHASLNFQFNNNGNDSSTTIIELQKRLWEMEEWTPFWTLYWCEDLSDKDYNTVRFIDFDLRIIPIIFTCLHTTLKSPDVARIVLNYLRSIYLEDIVNDSDFLNMLY